MIRKRFVYFTGFVLLIGILFTLSIFLANYIEENGFAQKLVQQFGYLGILILAIIGGLNLAIPIPAAVFTPVFLASGLPKIGIILALAIGTTIADIIGYLIGLWGRRSWDASGNYFFEKVKVIREKYRPLLIPIIFLYASFIPYPNEIIVIPLAFLGMRIRTLIIPLFLGSLLHNTIIVVGIVGISELMKF
jgi:membrane protein YqaA with SNARE-associated domain